jgi:pimeloyl-ACP methyl ester carboxylesterase
MQKHASFATLALALALVLTATGLAGADENSTDQENGLLATSKSYVEKFFTGEYDSYSGLMADELKAAFPATLAQQVLDQILALNGPLQTIGEPWLEDKIEVYKRVRVPAVFEKQTLDLRVVFNSDGRVAGFAQAPHVPSPAKRSADGSLRSEPNPEVEGRWAGSIQIPGSALDVQVDLNYKNGYWVGQIDLPTQGAKGVPLSDIKVTRTEATFSIAGVPGEPTFHGKLTDGAITGEFTQSGQSMPFRLGREELARPNRPQEPQPPFPYVAHDVTFANGEIELAGTLTVPEGKGPFPATVLISGSGSQDRNEEVFDHKPFLVLADHLTRAGIAVLRVDDRGVGKSGGSAALATSDDFAGDTLAGVNYLCSRSEIDKKQIGLIGHSEGGIIAPKLATESNKVAWIVLLAGPSVPGSELLLRQVELLARAAGLPHERIDLAVKQQAKLVQLIEGDAQEGAIRGMLRELLRSQSGGALSEEQLEEQVIAQNANLTSPWFRHFLTYDPRTALRKLEVPVLALYGEKDLQVDPKQNLPEARKALEQAGNKDFFVEEMEGLNHLFQTATTGSIAEYYTIEETMSPAALKRITEWIGERVKKP